MWIRSQDDTGLFMSYGMCIDKFDGEFVISDVGGFGACATYSTEEKALKVLDEIQALIYFNAKDNGFTYQMPQDEDVKL